MRKIILLLCMGVSFASYAQNVVWDADSIAPIFYVEKNGKTTTASWWYHNGKKVAADNCIRYIGEWDSFYKYFYSQYYRHYSIVRDRKFKRFYKNKNVLIDEGPNGYCWMALLFKDKRIVENVIIRRVEYSNQDIDYDRMVRYIISKTQGHWEVLNSSTKKYHMLILSLHLR